MCSKHSDVSSQKIPRQGISGEAFGIGAFETDDMDVYDHEINISDDYDIDLTVEDSLEKKKSFETEKDERNSIVYDDNNRRQLLDRLFNEGFTSNHSIFIVEKLMKNIRLKNNFVSTTDDCLDGFRSAKQIPSNKGENILNRNVIPLNWHMKGIGAIRQLYENESMSIISTMKEKEIERVKEMSEKRNEMMRNVDERIRIKNEENEEIIEKKKRMMKNEIKEEKIERKQMDTYLNKHFVREGIVTKKDDDDEKELEELQNMMRAAKLGNYGKETRKIIEWQPIELICRRCNIQFRSIIKSENGIIQTQEQSLKKSENEKQIKLSNIGKRSGQHSKNPFAFLNDTNGDLETNPLSNRKPKAAMIIDQIDNFDEMIMEEEMEESMANQTQLEEVFSSTIDEEDEGKQFGYSKETIDYLYDICRRDDDDDTQSDDLTKMPNSLKMFNESSNSSIQFRTAKQRQYSND
ncbi:hypothetical protein SNEBB_007490 [Seison nebaliae]|nr:hypothetical protein SNEBB_007490 [Seison nebaliae]